MTVEFPVPSEDELNRSVAEAVRQRGQVLPPRSCRCGTVAGYWSQDHMGNWICTRCGGSAVAVPIEELDTAPPGFSAAWWNAATPDSRVEAVVKQYLRQKGYHRRDEDRWIGRWHEARTNLSAAGRRLQKLERKLSQRSRELGERRAREAQLRAVFAVWDDNEDVDIVDVLYRVRAILDGETT